MSMFGSRKKTYVGTSVARVIEDDRLPDSIKAGAVEAIMQHSNQSGEMAMDALANGLATRVDRMYRYGKTGYVHGLPTGRSYSSITGRDVVEQAVEADVGPIDKVDYYKLGPVNLLHVGWSLLVSQYGYDSRDNSLTVDGRLVYLSNLTPVVVEASVQELENGSMDQWGPLPHSGATPAKRRVSTATQAQAELPVFIVDAAAAADYLKLEYCWEEDENVVVEGVAITRKSIKTGTKDLVLPELDMNSSYFQVRYLQAGKAGYWSYRLNSNTKPAVEAIFDEAPGTIGTFYPWAYFRFDKQPVTQDKSSADYLSTRKLLRHIAIDVDEMSDAIHENPDIADVEQAMLMLAVPAKTENELEQRYLFDFFSAMYITAAANEGDAISPEARQIAKQFKMAPNSTSIVIQDKRFKMALSFDTIVKRRVAGRIGKVGSHASGTNINGETKKTVDMLGVELAWTTAVPTHYYRRQISENVYEELLVTKLKMVYWIWGDYTATGDENDDILLVPLDRSIIQDYSLPDRERLFARSLHYIFNSRVVVKVKWYQTGIFRAVLVIAAVVITVYNIYLGAKALAAAIATGAAAAAVATMVIAAVVRYIVITLAARLFVKVVGTRVAFVVAIVAAVIGIYQVAKAGSLEGAPFARDLVDMSTGLTKATGRSLASDFNALQNEARLFEQEVDEKQKRLDEAEALLNNNLYLNPLIIWGESPSDFYQRTVHSGNIGMVGIDAVSSYVDIQLRLPKLSDSLGDFV